jgi:pyruvate/2-oxoglutarate dehydrogenase complex dihydrolipoamide dehydrogenase (E3) component
VKRIVECPICAQPQSKMASTNATPDLIEIPPNDEHNIELVNNVHPPEWINPEPASRYNLVVIGAGTAGLVVAAGTAILGGKVALIERHLMGGDCLVTGCVPSKAVIRSSRVYADIRDAYKFGALVPSGTEMDFPTVMERMRGIRARISHHDSAAQFRKLGADIFLGDARFSGPDTVEVEGRTLRFKKAVIATGARPTVPPIDGLCEAGYLTSETVFNLTERPNRLLVIGGGPLGCELAQVFCRLGSHVIIVEKNARLLKREDRDASDVLARAMSRDGVEIRLNTTVARVACSEKEKLVHLETRGNADVVGVDELLVGVGRSPNVEGLNLEAVGVEYDDNGITVNDYLQTTNGHIYAAGDVCLPHKFTHTADAAARIVIQNALFLGRKRLSALSIPWCTYTDPEIAHVGMYERDAQERGIRVETFLIPFSELDRAIIDGEEEGFLKLHIRKVTDKILGATIVARHAGEMISEITTAMSGGIGLKKIANIIHPYPTQAEAIKRAADEYNRARLTPTLRRLLSLWLSWTR